MPNPDISVHDLFSIVDEHRIYEFSKQYAFTNKAFADALRKHFAKELPSPTKKMTLNEIKKMVDKCFTHEYGKARSYDSYRDYDPEFQDWEAIGKDLTKVIRQLDLLVENAQASLAIDGALYLIKEVCNQFENDYGYEREDIDYDDLHLEDAIDTIRTAFEQEDITTQQKLSTVTQLEKLSHSEAFDYDSFGVHELIEDTRDLLLTDDERISLREEAFKHAVGDYDNERKAVELWDYLLSLNRQQQAIDFYLHHKDLHDLRTCYVKFLIDQNNLKEALATLDEGLCISACDKSTRTSSVPCDKSQVPPSGVTLSWQRTKLDIFEKLNDKDSIIRQLQFLFIEDNNPMEYYRHLKKIISSEEWPTFLTNLLQKRDFGLTADNTLAEIFALEHWYDRLFTHLMKADYRLLSALEQYAKHFDNDQQTQLVQRLEKELKQAMARPHTRNEYKEYTTKLITLRDTCPPGRTLADSLVTYCRQTYRNRPAMLDELKLTKTAFDGANILILNTLQGALVAPK